MPYCSDTPFRYGQARNRRFGRFQFSQIARRNAVVNCGRGKSRMALSDPQSEHVSEVDAALLDAELFLKYKSVDRAVKRLRTALEHNSRSIPLRERLREVCAAHKQTEEAARQCLALASL